MKRLCDIVLALAALVLLLPFLFMVAILLKLTGDHEVFYVQKRVGRGGRLFKVYKFTTMVKDSSAIGTGMIAIQEDPRVLPLGRILRRTKINELPQLVNILKGDMSIIGPRPLPQEHYDYYTEEVKEAIGCIRPGLSGVGSIVFRDEEIIMGNIKLPCDECYKRHIAPYKGILETWYADHQSFILDMKLIIITLCVVLNPQVDIGKYIRGLPPRPKVLQPSESSTVVDMGNVRNSENLKVIRLHDRTKEVQSYTQI